ncbi:zinc finger BED domain-containing protein 4 isoform X2 [Dendroctonus ponderosae]|uniref:zinc finger BED domain-containing protein 4 isoform X2 n=1 Tax=Dendroctonus ponderosae TaxID=77166 RepID=UPI00203623E0|nr:zinc finger BED domain-containing protein 4 isoform X2 [Dendroctonus ponderosae]
MAPKTSPVWTHFSNASEGKVKCLHCGEQLSVKNRSTFPLMRHIKHKHPQPITRETLTEAPIKEDNCSSSHQQLQRCLTFKMAPKKSQLWTRFSKASEGKVKCLYSGEELSVKNRSTFSLIRHKKNKHPTQPISRQTVAEAPIKEDNCSSSHQLLQVAEDSIQRPATLGAGNLQTINSSIQVPLSIAKQKDIDKQLISLIAKEYHPFSIVEDEEFKRLLYLLNPHYKVPTRKTVSNLMLPDVYNEALELVKSRLDRAFAVCLTTEGWTSRTNDCFYSVTAHYIVEESNNTFLSSDLLGCISYTKSHTAENIANKLREVIEEWKLTNKIVAVVSDNEANMKAAVRIGGWSHWGCFAHSLNRIAQAGLSEIKEVVDKITNIVGYFKHNSQALSQLQASTVDMDIPTVKLKNEAASRWNSTYDMIYRVLQMKNAIVFTLSILETVSRSKQHADFEFITQLHDEEWVVAEQAIKVLEIFNLITLAISSEQKLNTSTIIFYYKKISKHLNSMNLNAVMPQIKNMVEKLKFELKSRFKDIQENHLIAQATILDPRFKKFGFIDEEDYKRAVENLYTEVANTTLVDASLQNQSSDINIKSEPIDQNIAQGNNFIDGLWNDFDAEIRHHLKPSNSTISAVEEVNKYLEESILPRKDSSGVCHDPFVWWNQRKHIYPKLYQIMKTRLCIMATSVPCERIFSQAGQILSERREVFKTDEISRLVFLNYNLNNCD